MTLNTNESGTRTKDVARAVPAAELIVRTYLDSFLGNSPFTIEKNDDKNSSSFDLCELNDSLSPHDVGMGTSFGRISCCKSSQSLYCKECLRLLVPDHSLPIPVSRRKRMIGHTGQNNNMDMGCSEERPLKLPFNLQIVLDDRRGSATGLHAMALLNDKNGLEERCNFSGDTESSQNTNENTTSSHDCPHLGSLKLIDLANGDEIPRYQPDDATTFLLFPSPGESVPLESVAADVKTLVVLDCKWTKSKQIFRKNRQLSTLQRVHLSLQPEQSYYWRWHNAGPGMISTIEAIFYAAYEVSKQKDKHLLESNEKSITNSHDCLIDRNNLIHLLWLFGHQRATTFRAAQKEGVPAPWSDAEKERQREMRKQKGTWRQLRHAEDERRLKERNRLKQERDRLKDEKKDSD